MDYATKILAAIDLPPESVGAIPEWGIEAGQLFQRGMTGGERRKFELMFVPDPLGGRPEGDPRAAAVAFTLCNADGARVFTDAQIPLLAEKNSRVLDRLYESAVRLSGIQKEDAVDEESKNFAETSGSDSSSA
jgi:hypothetical protein